MRGDRLCSAQDDVHAAVRADDIAHLPDLERIRSFLERFLHLALHNQVSTQLLPHQRHTYPPKQTQVSTVLRGRAVGMDSREFGELLRRAVDLRLISLQDLDGLLLRTRNVGL